MKTDVIIAAGTGAVRVQNCELVLDTADGLKMGDTPSANIKTYAELEPLFKKNKFPSNALKADATIVQGNSVLFDANPQWVITTIRDRLNGLSPYRYKSYARIALYDTGLLIPMFCVIEKAGVKEKAYPLQKHMRFYTVDVVRRNYRDSALKAENYLKEHYANNLRFTFYGIQLDEMTLCDPLI